MIMKKYVKPMLQAEEFVPQEYVAACYIVNCNFPNGSSVWLETNGVAGLQSEDVYEIIRHSTPQCGRREGMFHSHTDACYQTKGQLITSADEIQLSGYSWSGCNDKHYGVLKNPVLNGYYKSKGAADPTSPNLFVFVQGDSYGSHSNIHGSLLGRNDVDSSNPKAS